MENYNWSRRWLQNRLFARLQLFHKINLRKQQALDAHPKTIQQINFTEHLSSNDNRLFFIIVGAKETILDFSQEAIKVL